MRWIVRNWHLKLSAVLLATVLYTGFVYSGSFSEATINVRVEQENASNDVFNLSEDFGLVEVRYRTITESAAAVNAESFAASVDFADYDMERAPQPQELPVHVTAAEGIQILAVEPATVRVALDRVETRTVPIEVDAGRLPDGLRADLPVLNVEEANVRGPASVVQRVHRLAAFVTVPASGIDVNEPVPLKPVDVEGQPVGEGVLDVDPETVAVQIDVEQVETTATVTVRPVIEGTAAAGFLLQAISVEPSTVTLRGVPEVLDPITEVLTEALDVGGLTADETFEAELVIPEGTELVGGGEAVAVVTATIVPSVSSGVFELGVECEGEGGNACLPLLPSVAVRLSGPGQLLSELDPNTVTPVVNVSGLAAGEYSLTPAITGLPDGIELLDVSPATVGVRIVAPATETPAPTPAP